MQTRIGVRDQHGAQSPVKSRTVKFSYVKGWKFPKCAWCKVSQLRILADVVVPGATADFVTTVGYCDSCHLATLVLYEVPAGAALPVFEVPKW